MNEQEITPRRHFARVTTFAWLALLTVLVALNHMRVSRATNQSETKADQLALTAVQKEIGELGAQIETLTQRAPLSQADFESAQQQMSARLTLMEQAIAETAQEADLRSLLDRVQSLEKQNARARRHSAAVKTPSAAQVLQPPFTLIGIELRGGERFLSIAPLDGNSVAHLRVLRPGDVQDHWRLDALDAQQAQFTVDGVTRRITLP